MSFPIFVISGPSGVGKSTIIKQAKAVRSDLYFAVSTTTRPPRPGEDTGDYTFVGVEEFLDLLSADHFIECTRRGSHWYGTPKSELEHAMSSPVLLDVDVIGAKAVKGQYPNAVLIFIEPPSVSVLRERILSRKDGMSDSELFYRLTQAEMELQRRDDYAYSVVNEDLDLAVKKVLWALMSGARGEESISRSDPWHRLISVGVQLQL